jgi:soluble lytic murein transglycosylase-like protein
MDMGKCFATCISYGNRQSVKKRFVLLSLVWIGLLSGEIADAKISPYDPLVKKHARRYGFDWRLISAQMYAESSFRPDVVSHAGSVGLMQIMPATAKWLGVDPKLLTKPEVSISLGCYYDWRLYAALKEIDIERDRLAFMMASYNCGPGRMRRARRKSSNGSWDKVKSYLPKETQRYVPKIFSKYAEYRKITL